MQTDIYNLIDDYIWAIYITNFSYITITKNLINYNCLNDYKSFADHISFIIQKIDEFNNVNIHMGITLIQQGIIVI